jgi:hypothetical protein
LWAVGRLGCGSRGVYAYTRWTWACMSCRRACDLSEDAQRRDCYCGILWLVVGVGPISAALTLLDGSLCQQMAVALDGGESPCLDQVLDCSRGRDSCSVVAQTQHHSMHEDVVVVLSTGYACACTPARLASRPYIMYGAWVIMFLLSCWQLAHSSCRWPCHQLVVCCSRSCVPSTAVACKTGSRTISGLCLCDKAPDLL